MGISCICFRPGSCRCPSQAVVVRRNGKKVGFRPEIVRLGPPFTQMFQAFQLTGNQGFLLCTGPPLELPLSSDGLVL